MILNASPLLAGEGPLTSGSVYAVSSLNGSLYSFRFSPSGFEFSTLDMFLPGEDAPVSGGHGIVWDSVRDELLVVVQFKVSDTPSPALEPYGRWVAAVDPETGRLFLRGLPPDNGFSDLTSIDAGSMAPLSD